MIHFAKEARISSDELVKEIVDPEDRTEHPTEAFCVKCCVEAYTESRTIASQ
jgi:hypothetical protein